MALVRYSILLAQHFCVCNISIFIGVFFFFGFLRDHSTDPGKCPRLTVLAADQNDRPPLRTKPPWAELEWTHDGADRERGQQRVYHRIAIEADR